MAAVLYLRMAPALRDALRASAAESGVSLNAFAVQALAGTERLGRDRMSDLVKASKDHDRVWAW